MRKPFTPFLATGLALALGACDMIGGGAPAGGGGYRVAEAPAPILAAAPPDPAMDDYLCRRNGVVLDVGPESCAAEGGFVALKPADDPIQWTAEMWSPPALAQTPRHEDRARIRATAQPALATLALPPAPLVGAPTSRPNVAAIDATPAPAPDGFGAPVSDRAARAPYLAFDPCAYALLAGPGCPGR